MNKLSIEIELPEGATVGDLISVRGKLSDGATDFIDWEKLFDRRSDAISPPGLILLRIADAIKESQ